MSSSQQININDDFTLILKKKSNPKDLNQTPTIELELLQKNDDESYDIYSLIITNINDYLQNNWRITSTEPLTKFNKIMENVKLAEIIMEPELIKLIIPYNKTFKVEVILTLSVKKLPARIAELMFEEKVEVVEEKVEIKPKKVYKTSDFLKTKRKTGAKILKKKDDQ